MRRTDTDKPLYSEPLEVLQSSSLLHNVIILLTLSALAYLQQQTNDGLTTSAPLHEAIICFQNAVATFLATFFSRLPVRRSIIISHLDADDSLLAVPVPYVRYCSVAVLGYGWIRGVTPSTGTGGILLASCSTGLLLESSSSITHGTAIRPVTS